MKDESMEWQDSRKRGVTDF